MVILLSSKVPIIPNLFLLKLISNITAKGRYIKFKSDYEIRQFQQQPVGPSVKQNCKTSQLHFLPAEDSSNTERGKKN